MTVHVGKAPGAFTHSRKNPFNVCRTCEEETTPQIPSLWDVPEALLFSLGKPGSSQPPLTFSKSSCNLQISKAPLPAFPTSFCWRRTGCEDPLGDRRTWGRRPGGPHAALSKHWQRSHVPKFLRTDRPILTRFVTSCALQARSKYKKTFYNNCTMFVVRYLLDIMKMFGNI